MRISVTLCALLLATTGVHAQKPAGLEVLAVEDIDERRWTQHPGVVMPHVPIYRTDRMGFPVVSWAGYLQLRHKGTGFLYASVTPAIPSALKLTAYYRFPERTDTNNWGDMEGFRQTAWTIRRWAEAHPKGQPLVIGDISAENGGFADYNGDGLADHQTHQLGMNFNFHLPSNGKRVRAFHLGVFGDEYLDVNGTRELVRLLVKAGASHMTTSFHARLTDAAVGKNPILGDRPSRDDDRSVSYVVGLGCALNLTKPPRSHGNHINVGFRPR